MSLLFPTLKGLWAGDLLSFHEYVDVMALIDNASPELLQQAQAYYEEEQKAPEYQGYGYMVDTFNSVAAVDISGKLIPKSNWLTRMFGMTGYDEVINAVSAAAMEPGIENILMVIDSPGGAVQGLKEAADVIKDVDQRIMPVSTFTSGAMHSAAMWIGSAAREIHATEMASVGSIGVIAVHQEISKMLEKEGVGTTVFTAGKYKGIGNPYEKLSESDKNYIQQKLDTSYDFFISAIAENRGLTADYVKENSAEGRDFYAREAIGVGLVDQLNSFQEVVKLLDSVHNSQQAVN